MEFLGFNRTPITGKDESFSKSLSAAVGVFIAAKDNCFAAFRLVSYL
ncbi:hypothetical protein C943_03257 [Mariniradius saccharolyticus AK6]|uniref:Uncharacterized protein n=1 Tax=Mariniradius saccharolyticus AK6 TaxID=1239962 RepID=M7XJF3_9BACT|nr:hypothetical protein C943_03257 [Mariniradius saccharolyticus AK6]